MSCTISVYPEQPQHHPAYQTQPVSLQSTWGSCTGKGGHKSYGPSEAGQKNN